MPRVKGGNTTRRRRKRILKAAKGYQGAKHALFKTAKDQVMKSRQYAFRDRRKKKGNFRRLWITRINAAARQHGLSYSKFMHGLKSAKVSINRKMLADIAVRDPKSFTALAKEAKKSL
ncbi:MAG: 50S ribosomal protein L20 [Acetilactobacillus jinshanensis]